VERETGVAAARVERLAKEFASPGPAVAVIGGAALAHTNGLVQALAVNALNALVGSVDAPGGVSFMPQGSAPAVPARTFRDALGSAAPQLLLLDEANLLFASPSAWKVADWLRQVPFVASFGAFIDDTSAHADLILPDHSFLESWVDSAPESGGGAAVATVAGPAMKPLYDTRSTPDVLLDVSRACKAGDAVADLRAEEARDGRRVGGFPSCVPGESRSNAPAARPRRSRRRRAVSVPLRALRLAGCSTVARAPAVLQELPDPLTTAMGAAGEMNPGCRKPASRMATSSRRVGARYVRAPVVLSPGTADAGDAGGPGTRTATRAMRAAGANPLDPGAGRGSGAGQQPGRPRG
jgi:hypothetical protein